MRLFVALPLSEGFRNEVAAYCRRLAPYFDSARPSWVPVENLHFTLHFFGEVDTGSLQELTAHIDDCSQIAPPLDLKTGGLSFLPSVRAPRILYLDAVIEPMAPLLTLVDALRSLA
ncbi:MAG: hypothetical protein N3A02_08760, partial [Rectinema sp.]|nr:hypothetical protein [Rectinema sp.]